MKKILILFLFIGLTCANAQWTDDYDQNTLVSESLTSDIESTGTKDGKTFVVFWDETDGYVLRVQLLDADGNRMFGSDGIVANTVADNSTWTATRTQAVDDDGNLYIGFTATGDSNGYINKISSEGEQLFGEGGINLGGAWDLYVMPDGDGGVLVSYRDGTSGETKLMKYNHEGTADWDAPIVLSSTDSTKPFTGAGEISALSDGSFVVLYSVKATSWTVDGDRWAQRIDAEGNTLWENPIKISNQTLRTNRHYSVLTDGDITYLGYYGSTGNRFDSFLQRIEADGSLPWGGDGADFALNDGFYEMETSIAMAEDASTIWAVANLTDSSQNLAGVYIQQYDKETGEVLLGDNAKEVFAVGSNWIYAGSLQLVNGNPLILFSDNISDGVNMIKLGVTSLDENGDFKWEEEYKWIATSQDNKSRVDLTENVNGQSVAVWSSNRNGQPRAYAQNIVVSGGMGMVDMNENSISIYPNPTSDVLNIHSVKTVAAVEVWGLDGRLLKKSKSVNSIDLSSLSKGVYLVKITLVDGKTVVEKVIKR